jgi:hypothetical protein
MVADFTPASNYGRVHCVRVKQAWNGTGRTLSMERTLSMTLPPRPVCRACAQGAICQTPTNPYRVHREKPELIGQQMVMDAFTSTHKSLTGNKHCDFLKCLKSHWVHPLFTKNHSAAELVRVITLFFNRLSKYRREASQDRFVRCDLELNYRSAEFVACLSSFG